MDSAAKPRPKTVEDLEEDVWSPLSDFPEIGFSSLSPHLFKIVGSLPWRISENTSVLEARTLVKGPRVDVSVHHVDTVLVMFVDNMNNCVSF